MYTSFHTDIFFTACGDGDIATVHNMIAAGCPVDVPASESTQTPLSRAALRGHAEVCDALIKAGADISQSTQPLELAVITNRKEVCAVLIAAGMDINRPDGQGNTPLHTALEFGWEEVMLLLLDAGPTCTPGTRAEKVQGKWQMKRAQKLATPLTHT
jgi:ankyrin repeat protein